MAIKENPNAAMFVRNLGQIYTYSRRFDEADKTLRQVAGMIKDPSPVYIEIGMNAQKAQRYPTAEEAFKKALEISPQTGNIHIYLSRLYLLMGKKEASLVEEKAFRAWERKKAEDELRRQNITPTSH
jgi:tetratricopeptide (TPR) repeat protein